MLSYRLGTVNDFHWEFKSTNTQKIVYSECRLRLIVMRLLYVLFVYFCMGHFIMVPLTLICLHCLKHVLF